MVLDEFPRPHIPNRAVCPLLIVHSPPGLNHAWPRFLQREKPVLVQTFISKLAVDAFNTAF